MFKKFFFLISFISLFLLFSCYSTKFPKTQIKIKDKIYKIEVAAKDTEKSLGLMFRKKLDKNSGMIFIYPKSQYLYFYMKNTFISLDIAFIDENYTIIDIQSMEPLDETTIPSKGKAMFALEVNRDFFKRIGVNVGDKIEFIDPIPYIAE